MKNTYDCAVSIVGILNPKKSKKIKLSKGKYTFLYDYPLENECVITRSLTGKETLEEIILLGAQDYQRIYQEEEATPGKYGIWGHSLGDLVFEGVEIDTKKASVYFLVGS